MTLGTNISDWSRDDFQHFVEEFGSVMLAFARRYTADMAAAEDIVQDCFCQLWLERERHREVPIKSAPAFAMTMIKNRGRNYVRSHRRTVFDPVPSDTPLADDFLVQLIDTQRSALLSEALATLPENWRQVMLLSLDGVPQKEISDAMGVTLDSVKAMKTRATARLRQILPRDLFLLCVLLICS